jgi:membrane associated rhomboid family serine protease
MIPLRDNIPSQTKPVVNYLIIGLTSVAFLAQLGQRDESTALVEKYGMVPVRVLHPDQPVRVVERMAVGRQIVERERPLEAPEFTPWLTLLTCIFLHGGWMHFLGNMWFLHIFGDNVEDRLGHLGYLLFYVGCGVAASIAHLLTNSQSGVPTIGASGAIAGVMGAYFLLYPRAMVLTLVPIFFFIELIVLPAPLFLGIWFLLQFFQGTLAVTAVETQGVAWWAHIGGFAAGFLVIILLKQIHALRPAVSARYPGTERMTMRRLRG